jgi:hypothetical protein
MKEIYEARNGRLYSNDVGSRNYDRTKEIELCEQCGMEEPITEDNFGKALCERCASN